MENWLAYELEVDGIINSIKSICDDHFMLGYTNHLKKAIKEKDVEYTYMTTNKMLLWLDLNLKKILESDFTYNKESHKLTYNILKKLNKDTCPIGSHTLKRREI